MRNRNRLLSIFLAVAVLAGTAVALLAFMQPSAEELLVQSLETTKAITDGHALMEFEADLPDEELSGTVEAWGKLNVGPNGEPAVRIEVLSASKEELGGTVFVADGTQFWLWNPTKNTVMIGNFEELKAIAAERMSEYEGDLPFDHEGPADGETADHPETSEEVVAKLLEYFTAQKVGASDVAGTSATQLRLIPIPEQMPEEAQALGGLFNVWLRADDSAPLAIEYTGSAAGSAKATATQLEINQGVDDSIFTFAIPEGAEVTDAADMEWPSPNDLAQSVNPADLDLLTPAELPQGATLRDTVSIAGTAVQQYSLPDGKDFTISQGGMTDRFTPEEGGEAVTVRGAEGLAFSSEDGDRTLLTWAKGETQFWIGGDLTLEQALAVAESLN